MRNARRAWRADFRAALMAAGFAAVASPVLAQQDTTRLPPGVELEMRYSKAGRPLIAVRPFTVSITGAGPAARVTEIVSNDLTLSDRFEMMTVPESLTSPDSLRYQVWNSLNVVYLITGDVQPSGFLNLVGGNIRSQSLADIYRHSEVFTRVRDYGRLKGKCGACEFKTICGGSRSRAYALTGDPMRSDPFCVYQPAAWRARHASAEPQADAAAGLN